MKLEGNQKLLRIFIGEADRWQGKPLSEAIVNEARTLKMAGATVLRGTMGFGRKAHLHMAKYLDLSGDLPVVIEIVDRESNIRKLLPKLDRMIRDGLVTIEKAHVILYRADAATPRARAAGRRRR